MSNADLDNFDPEIDTLLAQARWPDPGPHAVMRLRERWRDLSNARPRRLLWIGWLPAAAAAAVLVLAVGGTWFFLTQGGQVVPTQVAVVPVVPPPPAPPTSLPLRPSRTASPYIVAQPPTRREMLAVLPALPVVDVRATVRMAVDSAAQHDDASALRLLRPLRATVVERELAIAFASTEQLPQRRAAIRLLSEVGTPASAALLARVAQDPKLAADAMPGVARLGGVEAILALVRASQPSSRREAIGRLLMLNDEGAVSAFLAMVLDDARREEALAALHASPAPPVERFIANLDHPQVDRRFAAAKALGSMCDRDDVGQTLRRMVEQNHHRRAALAALLSCPSREAATYIHAARTRASSIDAEVRAVQTELQRMF
ncbi:MAG: hypothetical protein M3478_14780 [Planctomycetota bacterium]|nr:hypothetical protein [Planctomycetota bacterium]